MVRRRFLGSCEGVNNFQAGDVSEIIDISRCKWKAVDHCSGRDDGIGQPHLLLLPQSNRLLNNAFIQVELK